MTSNFTLADDGGGGTEIDDPPVGPAAIMFARHAAILQAEAAGFAPATSMTSSWGAAVTGALVACGAVSGAA